MKHYRMIAVILALTLLSSFHGVLAADTESFLVSQREMIERSIRLDEGLKGVRIQIEGLQNQIGSLQNQISGLQSQIIGFQGQFDGLRNVMMTGFGVLLAGMFTLIGFVLWDRRTAISPLTNKAREMEERQLLLIKAMKEYALKEPRLSEVLKSLGLL